MNPLAQLAGILDSDYNPDYWSDHVRIEAGQMVEGLDDAAWNRLTRLWPKQSVGWRMRLADASLLSEKPRVIPLLIQMLHSAEAPVGAAVAAVLLEKNYIWDPAVSLRADLQRHLLTASPAEAAPLKKLLAQQPA